MNEGGEVSDKRRLVASLLILALLGVGITVLVRNRPSADVAGADPVALADQAFTAGDFTLAVGYYADLYRATPGAGLIQQRYLASLMSAQQEEAAARLAEEILAQSDVTVDSRIVAANALALAGKSETAEQTYQAVLVASPNHPVAALNLADLYLRTDRPEAAKALTLTAAAANPKEPLLQWLLAAIYDELDDDVAAAAARAVAQRLETGEE